MKYVGIIWPYLPLLLSVYFLLRGKVKRQKINTTAGYYGVAGWIVYFFLFSIALTLHKVIGQTGVALVQYILAIFVYALVMAAKKLDGRLIISSSVIFTGVGLILMFASLPR